MALVSITAAMERLGYKNRKSIDRLVDDGVLTLVPIPGKKRATLRVRSADLDRIEAGQAAPEKPAKHVIRKSAIRQQTKIRHYA